MGDFDWGFGGDDDEFDDEGGEFRVNNIIQLNNPHLIYSLRPKQFKGMD